MTPDPRGRPTDEEYIKHLEFFNEQLRNETIPMPHLLNTTSTWKRALLKIVIRIIRRLSS